MLLNCEKIGRENLKRYRFFFFFRQDQTIKMLKKEMMKILALNNFIMFTFFLKMWFILVSRQVFY